MLLFTSKITQITQGERNCGLACIAMLADISLEFLIEKFPQFNEGITLQEIKYVLTYLFVDYIHYVDPAQYYGRVYLLSIPSLNLPNKSHCIITDYREKYWKVYDPNEGYPDRKVYTPEILSEIGTYYDVLEIIKYKEDE